MTTILSRRLASSFLVAAAAWLATAPAAFADGTQELGPPIGLAAPAGTRMILAGIGVRDGQPQGLAIDIPAGAAVRQVVAYWAAVDWDLAKLEATDEIFLNGSSVVGDRIGDPALLFNTGYNASYRADVTALHLLVPGANNIAVDGVNFVWPQGVGLVAFVDDGGEDAEFVLRDGNDVLSNLVTPQRPASSLVEFTFEPAGIDRVAHLGMFFASFFPDTPTVVRIFIDGEEHDLLADMIGHGDGAAWDTLNADVLVPAGVSKISAQLTIEDSGIGPFAGYSQNGKLAWLFGGLRLTTPPPASEEGCSTWYWKTRWWRWDGMCHNDFTKKVRVLQSFNSTFNVKPNQSGFSNGVSLLHVLWMCGGGNKSLAREAVAALCNADSDLDYPYTKAEVIALYRDGVGAAKGPENWCSAKHKLESANRLGCPLK